MPGGRGGAGDSRAWPGGDRGDVVSHRWAWGTGGACVTSGTQCALWEERTQHSGAPQEVPPLPPLKPPALTGEPLEPFWPKGPWRKRRRGALAGPGGGPWQHPQTLCEAPDTPCPSHPPGVEPQGSRGGVKGRQETLGEPPPPRHRQILTESPGGPGGPVGPGGPARPCGWRQHQHPIAVTRHPPSLRPPNTHGVSFGSRGALDAGEPLVSLLPHLSRGADESDEASVALGGDG